MSFLHTKYVNIQKFITEYRKYTVEDKFYSDDEFNKNMHSNQYVMHKCKDVKKNKSVYIYLFSPTSIYLQTTLLFKKIINVNQDKHDKIDIILITKEPISVYINKALNSYTNINFYNYLHKLFAIEIAKGPLCSKHTILEEEEAKMVCNRDLVIHPLSLPSISVNDPQNIWIGGEIGQIIKIESISEITGATIRYRIISPDTGKIINNSSLEVESIIPDISVAATEKNNDNKEPEEKENDDILDNLLDEIEDLSGSDVE